ncbi:MAG TPA: hypothetical protein VFK65_08850, partial [Candidatus Binatia bacterium]|nr:hypothetical protein [Candidatus Binatia bacterium]
DTARAAEKYLAKRESGCLFIEFPLFNQRLQRDESVKTSDLRLLCQADLHLKRERRTTSICNSTTEL